MQQRGCAVSAPRGTVYAGSLTQDGKHGLIEWTLDRWDDGEPVDDLGCGSAKSWEEAERELFDVARALGLTDATACGSNRWTFARGGAL